MREPPIDSPTIVSLLPSAPMSSSSAEFGCPSSRSALPKLTSMPSSFAISMLCGIRTSSVCMPKSPATIAKCVPCPFPVARNEPYRFIFALTIGCPISFLATYPIFTAPAVWELDGPTITGPIISNKFIILLPFTLRKRILKNQYPPFSSLLILPPELFRF